MRLNTINARQLGILAAERPDSMQGRQLEMRPAWVRSDAPVDRAPESNLKHCTPRGPAHSCLGFVG